jgi:hypothetical protein
MHRKQGLALLIVSFIGELIGYSIAGYQAIALVWGSYCVLLWFSSSVALLLVGLSFLMGLAFLYGYSPLFEALFAFHVMLSAYVLRGILANSFLIAALFGCFFISLHTFTVGLEKTWTWSEVALNLFVIPGILIYRRVRDREAIA